MDRATDATFVCDETHDGTAHVLNDCGVHVRPAPRVAGRSPAQHPICISDSEIAQLVSVALEDAIIALGQPNPESCLRLRAYEARASIRAVLKTLPRSRKGNEKFIREYRRAMVFQSLSLDLAHKLVDSIRRYAKAFERENPLKGA